MKKHKALLFQPYIRSFVTNFFKYSKYFEFIMEHKEETNNQLYRKLNDFNKEIKRNKVTLLLKIRRIMGIPNVRFKFSNKEDLFFTYGCLVVGNKPYCVYSETGLSIYNYDRKIANNFFARLIVSFIIRRKNCKKIIFLSEAAQKSFFSSARYSKKSLKIFKKKTTFCYPLLEPPKETSIKKAEKVIKFLFVGIFYMKGGIELVNAFKKVKCAYPNIKLTIVSSLAVIKKEHINQINSIPEINLLDAKFSKEEMNELYDTHHIFIMPTYRDGFGLSWVEALSHAMPIIGMKQFATEEFCINDYNGFMFSDHPLQDYNPETFEIYGKYYNPIDFYTRLFQLQKNGGLKKVENFLYNSMEKIMLNPELVIKFSENSLKHYTENFHPDVIGKKFDSILLGT